MRSGVFPVANREINITVSIGVAVGTEIPHEELYRYVDQALYQAKNTGAINCVLMSLTTAKAIAVTSLRLSQT